MTRLIICFALLVPLAVNAAPERRGRGGSGASDRGSGVATKVRRKTPSVRVKAKPQRRTLNVRSKAPTRTRDTNTRRPNARADRGAGPSSTRRPNRAPRSSRARPASRIRPAARSARTVRGRSVRGRTSYRRDRRPAYRPYGSVYVSTRRGPRHPGWSRRHFRVSHHTPLTIVIERAALQRRVNAAREDLVQVEFAINGLAGAHLRAGLMQHVRAVGFALDDIDAALYHARPYASYRRGWVILDQGRFWQRMRNAESAVARLDDEVASLQDAQAWSGHARLGRLDTHLGALGDSLVDADAYGESTASAPAEPPASDAEYGRLERALHAATFREEKLDLVRRAVQTQYFTTDQARGVARQMHADKDKVTVLTWLYPRLVDPERFDAAMGDVSEDGERRRLQANVYGR